MENELNFYERKMLEMIYVFLAQGFEETEAIAPIDCMRRCGLEVVTVGIGDNVITGSHGVTIVTDCADSQVIFSDEIEMIVLPGGMPGTLNLEKSEVVQKAIEYCTANDKYIAAICAAPSILGHLGLLSGHKAVCYSGFEQQLQGAEITDEAVCVSGKFITSKGMGTAVEFGLKLVEVLKSTERSNALRASILCPQ